MSELRTDPDARRIACIAGPVRPHDRTGHHDYLAGCKLLAALLERNHGVRAEVHADGWPADEAALDGVAAVLLYDGGGGKQQFLATASRIERLRALARGGTGFVLIHQTVAFPTDLVGLGQELVGGVYAPGESHRGHWPTHHASFPEHPITRGVEPWRVTDGWLNRIRFVAGMAGVTPLVWSGRRHAGSRAGGDEDVVGWAYERPDGGRAFCYTGIDAHTAWSAPGLRRLMVNGVLWSAGVSPPDDGAPIDIAAADLRAALTPRRSPLTRPLHLARKALRRLLRRARRW